MSRDLYDDGRLIERWDDAARVYTKWDLNGVQIQKRPYSLAENLAADDRVAQTRRDSTTVALKTDLSSEIQGIIDDMAALTAFLAKTNSTINSEFAANPAVVLRQIALDVRRVGRQTLRLTRLALGSSALDSPDVG